MRLLAPALAAGAVLVAASPKSAIYQYQPDPATPPKTVPTLSPSNAYLYLAQRLGLSAFHSLDDADDATLDILSSGFDQKPLFTSSNHEQKQRSIYFIEGLRGVEDVLAGGNGQWMQVLELQDVPVKSKTYNVLEEMVMLGSQESEMIRARESYVTLKDERGDFIVEGFIIGAGSSLSATYVDLDMDDSKYARAVAAIKNAVEDMIKTQEMTVVAVSPAQKHSPNASWDGGAGILQKRQQEEPILSSPASHTSPHSSESNMFDTLAESSNSTRPSTLLKVCSSSESQCISKTNSCSGHGTCGLKYTDSDSGGECWACMCTPTKGSSGTVYWGGPACQKRDISVQFWLFAGFGIFAAGTIAWGVGLLYSMGEAELPSVLSAGVAPPKK